MLVHILTFQFGNLYGGSIGSLLSSWENEGVFTYVLPFLLIFAVVFGILAKIKVFGENKGLNAVIALVIGLLSLQFQLVPTFFAEIFPQVGIGLSILLVLIILVGLFFDPKEKVVNYLLLGVGVIIFLTVLIKTSGDLGWYSASWWYSNWQDIILGIIIIGVIGAVIGSTGGKKPNVPPLNLNWGEK